MGVEECEYLGAGLRYPRQPRPDETRPLRDSEDADFIELWNVHIEVSLEDVICWGVIDWIFLWLTSENVKITPMT